MHNGTIYRWNRPVYDIHGGKPHLRVENRVLPAGPTIVDVFANGAFYYGLLRTLAAQDRPVWSQMSFATAEDNFTEGARHGIHAQLYWPGLGTVPVTELVLRRLLPMAQQGLADVGRGHRGQRPAAGRHRAPLHRLPQRRGVAGRRRSTGSTSSGSRWTAATRCGRCCAATASTCTPTSRSPTGPSARLAQRRFSSSRVHIASSPR